MGGVGGGRDFLFVNYLYALGRPCVY